MKSRFKPQWIYPIMLFLFSLTRHSIMGKNRHVHVTKSTAYLSTTVGEERDDCFVSFLLLSFFLVMFSFVVVAVFVCYFGFANLHSKQNPITVNRDF